MKRSYLAAAIPMFAALVVPAAAREIMPGPDVHIVAMYKPSLGH